MIVLTVMMVYSCSPSWEKPLLGGSTNLLRFPSVMSLRRLCWYGGSQAFGLQNPSLGRIMKYVINSRSCASQSETFKGHRTSAGQEWSHLRRGTGGKTRAKWPHIIHVSLGLVSLDGFGRRFLGWVPDTPGACSHTSPGEPWKIPQLHKKRLGKWITINITSWFTFFMDYHLVN